MKINAKQAQIAAIAALFMAPVVVAWFMFSGQSGEGYVPGAHGVLAEPPVPLGDMELPRAATPERRRSLPDAGRCCTCTGGHAARCAKKR